MAVRALLFVVSISLILRLCEDVPFILRALSPLLSCLCLLCYSSYLLLLLWTLRSTLSLSVKRSLRVNLTWRTGRARSARLGYTSGRLTANAFRAGDLLSFVGECTPPSCVEDHCAVNRASCGEGRHWWKKVKLLRGLLPLSLANSSSWRDATTSRREGLAQRQS